MKIYSCTLINSILLFTLINGAFSISFAEDQSEKNLNVQFENMTSKLTDEYAAYEDNEVKKWNEYKSRIQEKWPDGKLPEQRLYIQYFDKDNTRVSVDYEHGMVIAETLLDIKLRNSRVLAKGKISDALISIIEKDSNSISSIIQKSEIDQKNISILNLTKLITKDVKSSSTIQGSDGKERQLYRVQFKLVPNYIKLRADKYFPTIKRLAAKYDLDPAFVLAVIRQESAFNPRARSWVPAYGLMQIVPKYAGKEVMEIVTGKSISPGSDFLYNPENNILIGTTYLQILRDKYFKDIKDETKRLYLITCAYNWGPQRILSAIDKGRLSMRSPSSEVFSKLQKITPTETQGYLLKVTQYAVEFKTMGFTP